MSRSHLGTAGLVFIALLAFPRASSAGLMDYIHEMSGPQMGSFLLVDCEYSLRDQNRSCYVYDHRVSGDTNVRQGSNLWFTLAGGAYTSTWKDSKTGEYGWFENYMIAFEPMLFAGSSSRSRHGIGLTYNFLFGERFGRFNNLGVKIVPFSIPLGPGNLVITARYYPDRFTTADFDAKPRAPEQPSKRELVLGAMFEWRR